MTHNIILVGAYHYLSLFIEHSINFPTLGRSSRAIMLSGDVLIVVLLNGGMVKGLSFDLIFFEYIIIHRVCAMHKLYTARATYLLPRTHVAEAYHYANIFP